jgi:hypothetical protein
MVTYDLCYNRADWVMFNPFIASNKHQQLFLRKWYIELNVGNVFFLVYTIPMMCVVFQLFIKLNLLNKIFQTQLKRS